jgi:hypothetical protein
VDNESVNELKALDGTDDARSQRELGVGKHKQKHVIGPPSRKLEAPKSIPEYTNFQPVRRDMGSGTTKPVRLIAVDEDSEWNEETN